MKPEIEPAVDKLVDVRHQVVQVFVLQIVVSDVERVDGREVALEEGQAQAADVLRGELGNRKGQVLHGGQGFAQQVPDCVGERVPPDAQLTQIGAFGQGTHEGLRTRDGYTTPIKVQFLDGRFFGPRLNHSCEEIRVFSDRLVQGQVQMRQLHQTDQLLAKQLEAFGSQLKSPQSQTFQLGQFSQDILHQQHPSISGERGERQVEHFQQFAPGKRVEHLPGHCDRQFALYDSDALQPVSAKQGLCQVGYGLSLVSSDVFILKLDHVNILHFIHEPIYPLEVGQNDWTSF